MATNIGELFITLGIDSVKGEAALKSFTASTTTAVAAGTLIVQTLTKAVDKFVELASAAMDAAMAIDSFELQTGLSGLEMQRWDNVAKQTGMSAGSFAANVKSLQKNLNDLSLGGGNASPYMLMGINPMGKGPFELLAEMREYYQKAANKGRAVNFLEQAGINADMIKMLSLSKDKFEELSGVVIITPEQRDSLVKLHMAFAKFNMIIQDTMNKFVAQAGPALVIAFEMIGNGIKQLTWLFKQYADSIGIVKVAIDLLLAFIVRAQIGAMMGWLMTPLGQITTAIVILSLLIDDIMGSIQGKRSVVGLVAEYFRRLFAEFTYIIKDIEDRIDRILSKIPKIGKYMNALWREGSTGVLKEVAKNFLPGELNAPPPVNVIVPIRITTKDADLEIVTPDTSSEGYKRNNARLAAEMAG
jgi:hypothetical protein